MGTIGCGRRSCSECKRKVCTVAFRSLAMCLHVCKCFCGSVRLRRGFVVCVAGFYFRSVVSITSLLCRLKVIRWVIPLRSLFPRISYLMHSSERCTIFTWCAVSLLWGALQCVVARGRLCWRVVVLSVARSGTYKYTTAARAQREDGCPFLSLT